MKFRGIFEYEYPVEHKPPVSIDVYLHGDCVKGKIIEWEYRPLEQELRWIPVSEYLPVTNDEVLVTYIVNGNAKKKYVETANCFDGEWSSVNDEYRIPNTKIEIIAWCEMPKPYKAETEDT